MLLLLLLLLFPLPLPLPQVSEPPAPAPLVSTLDLPHWDLGQNTREEGGVPLPSSIQDMFTKDQVTVTVTDP